MYKTTLENMKELKYKDLLLIRARCKNIRQLKNEFDAYLFKETHSLISEAKEIDAIRS